MGLNNRKVNEKQMNYPAGSLHNKKSTMLTAVLFLFLLLFSGGWTKAEEEPVVQAQNRTMEPGETLNISDIKKATNIYINTAGTYTLQGQSARCMLHISAQQSGDEIRVIFEKDPAPMLVGASGLYTDKEITTPLTTAPVGGETYYFAVTLEDAHGQEGHPDVFYSDKMKTGNDASAEEAEVEYVSLTRSPGGKYATVVFSYKPAEIVYTFEKGADASWEKGAAAVQYVVKRNLNDEKTFGLFDHIEVDGTALAASDFTAVSGSLDATLKTSYLETLAAGAHDVKIFFEDGVAETKLTIKETAGGDGSDGGGGSGGGSANGGSNGGSPQTGDSSQLHLYLALIAASLLVLLAVTLVVSVKRAGHGRRRM